MVSFDKADSVILIELKCTKYFTRAYPSDPYPRGYVKQFVGGHSLIYNTTYMHYQNTSAIVVKTELNSSIYWSPP